jgi:glycosyltransferase involved in cell wall biosynthesis
MKVLWFAPTPSLSESHISNVPMGGGWIKSLEKQIQNKVELSIAFYHNKQLDAFTFGNTNYYPIVRPKTSLKTKITSRLFSQIEPESEVDNFMNVVNQVKPDVIHIHGSEGPFGLVQERTGIPVVISIQGILESYRLKYFSGIPYSAYISQISWLKRITFSSEKTKYGIFAKKAAREIRILKQARHVIGRTDWDRHSMRILAPNAIYHYGSEILRDVFYESRWKFNTDEKVRVHTTTGGNIYKGFETIVQVAALLDNLNIDFSWTIAGMKATNEMVGLTEKVLGQKTSKKIVFLGVLNEFELRDSMLNAHIYVMPSHIENSPNSLCEAQIMGMPCISAHAGGTSTIIKDGEDGILVQDGDPYSLAGALLELSSMPNEMSRLGNNAANNAKFRHNPQTITDDLMKVYTTLTDGLNN